MKKLVAIDGNSIMNRAFYGIMHTRMLSTTDGIYTNAIYGFLSILFKLINDENPDYICVTFDLKAPTFRHKKYDGYKATRKGMPDELRMQMPLIKDVLRAMNIKILEIEGYEADDILGTLAKYGDENNMQVLLLTGDRDALQLVSNNVTVRIPTTKMGTTESTNYTPNVVKEKYGVEPIEFIQTKGLMGDTSDNIPGVPGVGEKTAFSLIKEYHNIDYIYDELEAGHELEGIKGKLKEKIIGNKDLAFLSRELGTIYKEVPIKIDLSELEKKEFNNEELYNLFVKLQFKNFIEKLGLTETKTKSTNHVENEKIEIKDINKLDLTKKEYAFYFKNGIAIYDGETAYYTQKPSVEFLQKFFENDCLKIGFEEKETYLFLKKNNIKPNNLMFDIAIASYILNPSKDSYRLDDIILEELGIIFDTKSEESQMTIDGFNTLDDKEIDSKYAKYIFEAKKELEKKLNDKEQIKLFNEIEMPLVKVLAEMEYTGVLVDKNLLEEYGIDFAKKIDTLMKEIWEMAGEEFNINSPKQLGVILFEKLNLPVIKKTKSGYSTDADVLDRLKFRHPIIGKILEYRTISKLKTTYVDGMLPLISKEDGRIHANFKQTVTATGRISCTDPNLQNIPIRTELGKELRKIFVAPKNSVLIDADYSQIELRVLSHISGDEKMIDAFKHDKDIHATTASQVFDVPLEEVTKQMRSEAKAVNFGIVYGISDFGLASNIGTTRKNAKEYIEKYFKEYPNIKSYMDKSVEKCKEQGYVETLWGRRRYVPEIKSNNFNVRQFGERVAMNAPIQGTAADIIKIAMVHIQKALEENNLKSKLILQVHDELVIESPIEEQEKAQKLLVECMENVVKMSVPLKAEAQIGANWFEAH